MNGDGFAIEARGLTRSFGPVRAVDGLDLSVRRGEVFGFLGPNGAGKTTTIRMLATLLAPDAGEARVGGHDVRAEGNAVRAAIGYLPETPFLYDKLTAREFLDFVAEVSGVPAAVKRERIEGWLRFFRLADAPPDDFLEAFSQGMRKKVALAATLLHEPSVLFLDEPTSSLDPASARLVKDLLRDLARRGATVFLSSHILEVVEEICDRVAIIHRGRLVACGTLEELRAMRARREGTLEEIFLELTEEPGAAASAPPS